MSYRIITKLLTPNQYSRPQKNLIKVKAIVVHWVANPKSSALSNRNYFENRKNGKLNYGSAHEIIDLNGDIVACVPKSEITYNCGSKTYTQRCLNELGNCPNSCTYGIECTHIDWAGKMTDATYNTLVERCADLCKEFNLNPLKNIWTHKEVVGWKDCHKWFVDHPDEWQKFKERVQVLKDAKEGKKMDKNIPQWKQDAVKWLKSVGILTTDHSPVEPIDMGTLGTMLKNFVNIYKLNK
jgi:N-acetylmuramoyl-L-alanine amidase